MTKGEAVAPLATILARLVMGKPMGMNMRNVHWIALGALIALLGLGPTARANLILSAQPVTAGAGAVNDMFNVYLTNTGATVNVGAFSFEISTASTDVVFQSATTGTTLFPYIFAGPWSRERPHAPFRTSPTQID
jgi:hypothetical protein